MSLTLLDEPLAPRTTFRLGGPARRLIEATDEGAILDALADDQGDALFILGGGSNVLVADEGVGGTVLAIRSRGVTLRREGERVEVTAAAGEPWDDLVTRCVGEGLSGMECLGGIPGQVGATPIQNVGAYGQEVSDTIVRVRAFDRHERRVVELPASECGFAYRDSAFKSRWPGRFVVLAVTFALRSGPPTPPRYAELEAALGGEPLTGERVRATVVELRRRKGMVVDEHDPDTRSAGSFFTNPLLTLAEWEAFVARASALVGASERIPSFEADGGRKKVAAAWLIERAGFRKGTARGGAAVSSKHALSLVNRGGSAHEVVALAREIQEGVLARFGVRLTPEPVLVGFEGRPLG